MARAPIIISNGGIVGILEGYMKDDKLDLGQAFKKLYKDIDTYATEYTPNDKAKFIFWHLEGEKPKDKLLK